MANGSEMAPITNMDSERAAEAFATCLDLSGQIDTARASLADLERQKGQQIVGLHQELAADTLPDDAKILVAALLHHGSADTAEDLEQNVMVLDDIDQRVKQFRGQPALWFSSQREVTLHRSIGPNEYQTFHYLHIGMLASDAQLQVGRLGQLIVPLTKDLRAPISLINEHATDRAPEQSLERLLSLNAAIAEPAPETFQADCPHIAIDAPEGLDKFALITGDAALEEAFSHVRESEREGLIELKDRLAAMLF